MRNKLIALICTFTLGACASGPQGSLNGNTFKEPTYEQMYLRGVFNWWEATDQFKFQQRDALTYTVDVELIADGQPYDFKVADGSWSPNLNCGQASQEQIRLKDSVELVCQSNSLNLLFIPDKTGTYQFSLDISDTYKPALSIELL